MNLRDSKTPIRDKLKAYAKPRLIPQTNQSSRERWYKLHGNNFSQYKWTKHDGLRNTEYQDEVKNES